MKRKAKDLIIIYACYILAYLIAFFVYRRIDDEVLSFFIFDIISTIVVYLFGVLFKNSSVYDPYWSLTPLVMLGMLMVKHQLYTLQNIIFVLIFTAWSMRLTINWMITFKDMSKQDWRYQMYKDNNPKLWQVINFFGINMFPTVLVYLAFIPAIIFMKDNTIDNKIIFGLILMIIGVGLEFFSDRQIHSFLKMNDLKERKVCNVGLWKYSRHPNYLGEITFWYGIYFCLLVKRIDLYYLIIGPILINCLFIFISIPMMEKRQIKRRTEYKEYQEKVSKILILPNRKR